MVMTSSLICKSKASLSKVLLVAAAIMSLLGIALRPWITWVTSFALALLLIPARRELQGGLGLLWGVRLEPAPSDILFIWAWIKRLVTGQLRWTSCLASNLLPLFILLNLLQIFVADSWNRGLRFAGITGYTIFLALLFSGISNVELWCKTRTFYLVACWVTVFTILLLVMLYFLGWADHVPELYYAGRPKGFFKDPNVAGPFMATGALFLLSQLVFLRRKIINNTSILLLFASLGVLSTFSRGAILNLAVGTLAIGLVAFWARKGRRFAALLTLGTIFFAAAFLCISRVPEQASRFRGFAEYDIHGRFATWHAGLLLLRDYPLGVGPGQFEIHSPNYQTTLPGPVIITLSAHNLYLRVLAENGVLGFAVLLVALVSLIRDLLKGIRIAAQNKDREFLTDGAWLLSSIVGILAESFVIDTLHWRHFWILFGLAIAYQRLVRKMNTRT